MGRRVRPRYTDRQADLVQSAIHLALTDRDTPFTNRELGVLRRAMAAIPAAIDEREKRLEAREDESAAAARAEIASAVRAETPSWVTSGWPETAGPVTSGMPF